MSLNQNVSLSEIRDKFDSAQQDIIHQQALDVPRFVDEIEDMIYRCAELRKSNRAEMVRQIKEQLRKLGKTGRELDTVSIDYIREISPQIDINP